MFPNVPSNAPFNQQINLTAKPTLKRTHATADMSKVIPNQLFPFKLPELASSSEPLTKKIKSASAQELNKLFRNSSVGKTVETKKVDFPETDLAHLEIAAYFLVKDFKFQVTEEQVTEKQVTEEQVTKEKVTKAVNEVNENQKAKNLLPPLTHSIKFECLETNSKDCYNKIIDLEEKIKTLVINSGLRLVFATMPDKLIFNFTSKQFQKFKLHLHGLVKRLTSELTGPEKIKLWSEKLRSSVYFFPNMQDKDVRNEVRNFLKTQAPNQYGFFSDSNSTPGKIVLSVFSVDDKKHAEQKKRWDMGEPSNDLFQFWTWLQSEAQMKFLLYSKFLEFTSENAELTQPIELVEQKPLSLIN